MYYPFNKVTAATLVSVHIDSGGCVDCTDFAAFGAENTRTKTIAASTAEAESAILLEKSSNRKCSKVTTVFHIELGPFRRRVVASDSDASAGEPSGSDEDKPSDWDDDDDEIIIKRSKSKRKRVRGMS